MAQQPLADAPHEVVVVAKAEVSPTREGCLNYPASKGLRLRVFVLTFLARTTLGLVGRLWPAEPVPRNSFEVLRLHWLETRLPSRVHSEYGFNEAPCWGSFGSVSTGDHNTMLPGRSGAL